MIDLAQYRQASFRNVKFHYIDSARRFGRRIDVKEYPFREESLVTDMGKTTDRIEMSIYVLGPDALDRRAELEEAMDTPGPGRLVHPTRGELDVVVDSGQASERADELGVADFRITFIVVDTFQGPTAQIDTRSDVTEKAANAEIVTVETIEVPTGPIFDVFEGAAGDGFLILDFSDASVLDELNADMAAAAEALKSVADLMNAGLPGNLFQAYAPAGGLNALSAAQSLASNAFSFLGQWQAFGTNPPGAFGFLNRLLDFPDIAGLFGGGSRFSLVDGGTAAFETTPTATGFTATRRLPNDRRARNRQGLAAITRHAAAVTAARVAIDTEFDDVRTATIARDRLTGHLGELASAPAPPRADPQAVNRRRSALRALRSAVYRDMTERLSALPTMARHTPQAVEPARVLAYRLAAGTDTPAAIVKRNAVKHPSFVPAATPLIYRERA